MTTRSRLLFCFVLLGIVLGFVENADATPITWTYEGSVIQRFQPPVIPVGTPVPFTVTADPAANLLAGSSFFPDFMGAYLATIHATMAGVEYTVGSALEVNGDPLYYPIPGTTFQGATALRELDESTNQGFIYAGGFPNPTIAYVFQPCRFGIECNGLSPALLMPYSQFDLALFVAPTGGVGFPVPSRVDISGHLVPAPEPASGTLMALGLAAAALAKRLRRAGFHA